MESVSQVPPTFWGTFLARLANWRRLSVISTILIVVTVVLFVPRSIPFWQFTVSDVVNLLMMLFLVALFIERAVEVIMGAWRGREKQELQAEVTIKRRLPPDSRQLLEESERAYESYKAQFRVLSLLVALLIGLMISALGLRILQPLVDPAVFKTLTAGQRALFAGTDTFVTGAMLGGGSEGIHRVLDTFLSQFDRWRQYTKDKSR